MDNDTESIKFNSLEFNLYELLNLPIDCTTEQVKKTFRKLIKQFHPDKITDVEEKIYYNLTLANHILGNQNSKDKYDRWLLKSNQSHSSLKDNFKTDEQQIREYFPQNKEEASVEFAKNFDMLGKRHGDYKEDNRSLQNIYKDKEKERVKVNVKKENFSSMDEFNNTFSSRKTNGSYSTMLVKRTTDIQPFSLKSSNLAELKHFDKVYINDTQYVTAFELIPSDESKFNNKNIKERLDDYKSTSQSLKRNNVNFEDLNI
uniref:J domain-containing protein n=1 Tax=viral metagenome TaxID=1070528 RepID=A0A6C0HVM5_9ZZZZ